MDKTELTSSTDATTLTNATISTHIDVERIKKDIEEQVNPKSISAGIRLLNNPNQIQSIMQSAYAEFEQKTGRQKNYSEMREMMG